MQTLKVFKTFRVFDMEVLKTQMGTTLSSCSHFVVFELLQPRRQATVIMAGWISIFFVLAHSVDLLSQPIAFGFCFLWHHLRAVPSVFLAEYLPGRSVFQITTWFISRDQKFCCREHFQLFSYRVPRNIE